MRIGRFSGQIPLGTRPRLVTQPRYEATNDHRVEIVEKAVINIELVKLFPQERSRVRCGAAK